MLSPGGHGLSVPVTGSRTPWAQLLVLKNLVISWAGCWRSNPEMLTGTDKNRPEKSLLGTARGLRGVTGEEKKDSDHRCLDRKQFRWRLWEHCGPACRTEQREPSLLPSSSCSNSNSTQGPQQRTAGREVGGTGTGEEQHCLSTCR